MEAFIASKTQEEFFGFYDYLIEMMIHAHQHDDLSVQRKMRHVIRELRQHSDRGNLQREDAEYLIGTVAQHFRL